MNDNDALDPRQCKEIVELRSTAPRVVLHRLAAVRRQKGIHRRVLADRLGISVKELRVKEESADLSINTLRQWAAVLEVPITELVVESDECLPPTRLTESQAARLMKMAARLRDRSGTRHSAARPDFCRAVGGDSARTEAARPKEPSPRSAQSMGRRRSFLAPCRSGSSCNALMSAIAK